MIRLIFPVNGIFAVNRFTVGQNLTDTSGTSAPTDRSPGAAGAARTGDLEYLAQLPAVRDHVHRRVHSGGRASSALAIPTSPATTPARVRPGRSDQQQDSTGITAAAWSRDGLTYTHGSTQQISGGNGEREPGHVPARHLLLLRLLGRQHERRHARRGRLGHDRQPRDHLHRLAVASGSSCASGTGNFSGGKNNMTLNNLSGIGGAFQIYVYGTPGCTTTCPSVLSKNNGTYTDVDIYAPYSQYSDKNNSLADRRLRDRQLHRRQQRLLHLPGADRGLGRQRRPRHLLPERAADLHNREHLLTRPGRRPSVPGRPKTPMNPGRGQ